MRKKTLFILVITFLYLSTMWFVLARDNETIKDPLVIQDVSRLHPVRVKEVIGGKEESVLVEALQVAQKEKLKVSISGAKHTQGGHTYYKDALVLDMTGYNKILDLNQEKKTIRVQSGTTWKDIQEYINPYGLSIKVMQSSNIFTVGGSLSANAHGRDIVYGPIINTVNSFRLLMADGTILNVSRNENAELFKSVIGGYGLFGVILDVDLQLTDDELYRLEYQNVSYEKYPSHILHLLETKDYKMHIARLSTAKSSFLKEMYTMDYKSINESNGETLQDYSDLKNEKNVARNKFLFGLSRHSEWGRERIWDVQSLLYKDGSYDLISRNNAMRPEIKFLEYESTKDTDLLQEYFIPVEQFPRFVDEMREIVVRNDINLFNVSVRYVKENHDTILSYAIDDSISLALYINQGFSKKEREKVRMATQDMVDAAHELGGTYYLAYQEYPSRVQMEKVYPNKDQFYQLKQKYDPEERFYNYFYERYITDEK
ncbi:FAD-binding protein [Peribacillus alkalitolerans]|uniref:FAD-dependent oxidoreductase n=1 Tax=Peribacillus alkalitolerans TaxID=1550385 RepID=UPI0013D730C0|nr:FAD-binding oxidoreductase [Peribacillus alkalitolerans]